MIRWQMIAAGSALIAALVIGAYMAGGWKERSDQRAKGAEARVEHIEKAEEVEDEIENLDATDFELELDGRLSSGAH